MACHRTLHSTRRYRTDYLYEPACRGGSASIKRHRDASSSTYFTNWLSLANQFNSTSPELDSTPYQLDTAAD